MRIQNNITADNSQRQLGITTRSISANTEKLSSGFRVNRAADDAAGLAISEKTRTMIRGLNRASLNIQDGISLLQVGDGALQSVHNKMQRMRSLSIQAANGTNQDLDREAIQLEFGQLTSEVNQVIAQTNFNGKVLFDGSVGSSWSYHLGKRSEPFITTIPAADDFVDPTDVPGFTVNPTFFGVVTGVRTDLNSAPFPTTGMFAMQIVTPADGTLNMVLDFANPSSPFDGTMDGPNGFLNFFKNGFNSLGLGDIVENIRYVGGAGRIEFDFPGYDISPTQRVLTGVMGKPGTEIPVHPSVTPRAFIGIGHGDDPGLFGGDAQRATLNGEESVWPLTWTSEPIRTNRPQPPNAPITEADIDNGAIFTTPATLGLATGAGPPAGGFSNITITIDSTPTTIQLMPDRYTSIEDFVDKNKEAFDTAMPNEFTLSIVDGMLSITTEGENSSPTVSMAFNPGTLADLLGFGPSPSSITEAMAGGLPIQAGANRDDVVWIQMPSLDTRALGLSIRRPQDEADPSLHWNSMGADGYAAVANVTGTPMEYSLDVSTQEGASASLNVLTNAINIISMERARVGAQQNRLEFTMKNVDNTSENLQAAESRIRDTDMAKEMTVFVKNQILHQSGTAMLAQANAFPNATLQLLG